MEMTLLGIKLDQDNDKLLVNLENRLSKISPSTATASTSSAPIACCSKSIMIDNQNNNKFNNGIVVMDTNEIPTASSRNLAFPLPFNLQETQGPFQNPFRLFPDFVWLKIFNQCPKPTDFKTFLDTCPQFHSLLQKGRTARLFPEVIKIILDKMNPRWNAKSQFGPREILNMRFVCTAWSNGIKDYLQNDQSHLYLESFPEDQDHPVQPYFRSGQKNILETFKLDWHSTLVLKVNDPGNFLHYITKPLQIKDYFCAEEDELRTRKNPIVTREFIFNDAFSKNLAADIETQGRRVPLDIHNMMEHFLEWTGNHIWYVTFVISNITVATYYQRLYRWLANLPNLKSLKLYYRHDHAGNNFPNNAAKTAVLSQLRRETEAAPIPFARVENVKLLDLKNVPAPIVRELLRTCVNVEKLKIDYDSSHDRKLRVDNECQLSFPENSASFGVHCKEMMIRIRGFDDFVHFETSGLGKSCSLETLFLHCRAVGDDDPGYSSCPSWQRIFTLLATRFGATLKHLKLSLPKAVSWNDKRMIMEQCNVYRLELPHLKSLRVFVPNLASIDFLLPLGNTLEELEVMITHGEEMRKRDRQKEIIKFHGFHEKMTVSNIWEKLPNLREIMIDKLRPVEANSNTYVFVRYYYKRTEK